MIVNIFKTVILTAGVFALYYWEFIEKQTSVALIAFIFGYFFGMKGEEVKRTFKRSSRTSNKGTQVLNRV